MYVPGWVAASCRKTGPKRHGNAMGKLGPLFVGTTTRM
jgi:hypothetical protein